uniref:Uncharacterized protein n=1 Tax=Guillardia theta TaxID=55529 RepID=A0A7S4NPF3_GUITH|mmetsp:Transcript_27050/g.88439  ORF Transcript_27050/g.88439 Transcript_27050/m.88439 type:complete len:466 (+) Transcript_27050:282-1679(+)
MEEGPLFPLNSNDYLIFFLTFCASALGAAGGIGGGGIMVPLLVSVGGFSVHHAIPLTQATVLGASIMNLIYNVRKRNPVLDRPLIDYNTALILEVTTLLGTVIGVDVNKISPVWLITILLIVTLGYTTYRTLRKGLELRAIETGGGEQEVQRAVPIPMDEEHALEEEESSEADALMPTTVPVHQDVHQDVELEELDPNSEASGSSDRKTLVAILQEERKIPVSQVFKMALVSGIVLVISVMKGGGRGSSLVTCGSFEYWLIKASTFPILGFFAFSISRELVERDALKDSLGYTFTSNEIRWTVRSASYYPFICISAGIAAGLLGIGGGMLKGPIMLEMGLPPSVVSATAAYMLLWTTASTTIQFGVMGEMLWDYALALFFVGLVSSILGQTLLSWAVSKYKKQYLITLMIALVIGFSTVFMGISGLQRTYAKYVNHEPLGLKHLCDDERTTVRGLAGDRFEPAFE